MTTALITHSDCIGHDPGPGHPECPDRLRAVLAALDAPEFATLLRLPAPEASEEQLCRAHPPDYVAAILALEVAAGERLALDPDTQFGPGTRRAALLAAGGAVAAVDAVLGGQARTAFAAIRPPGHHAEPARPMGFCLFNNVAVAAQHARARWGKRRIAVVDFDVHHGNGTEAMFARDGDLFYASSHQFPCYPGTGRASDTGIAGNIVNLPLPPGAGSAAFRAGWDATILPALEAFAPEVLIVSAGFDAHRADPLAALELETEDFVWLTHALLGVADRHCDGRMVSVLEGGYDLAALAASAAAHVRVLMQGAP
ncbi:MAG: histone deacetylase family protein [Rhodospirillales bacterium]|nr:histone deacetylase family protein [Rhodospirillales bacterium]